MPNAPVTTRSVLLGVVPPLPVSLILAPLAPVSVTVTDDVLPDVVDVRVVNAPVFAVVEPIAPGEANVAPPRVAALIVELQVKPVFVTHSSALFVPLQPGIASAVGDALLAVALAITVFAATGVRPLAVTFDHAGAELAPVETIACPELEPAGLSS